MDAISVDNHEVLVARAMELTSLAQRMPQLQLKAHVMKA